MDGGEMYWLDTDGWYGEVGWLLISLTFQQSMSVNDDRIVVMMVVIGREENTYQWKHQLLWITF
jgi:hypothetical protein